MTSFNDFCEQLEIKIQATYEQEVSIEDAVKLAAEFLHGQIEVSKELKKADLDSRMRKSGLKAVKAAIYMEACGKSEKKPSDVLLEHTINLSDIVSQEQDALDKAESDRDALERHFNIFQNAHIYYRGIGKGNFS